MALLLSLLAPAMLCALPASDMTASERACCRQMRGECSGMRMPASHSCYQQNVSASHIDAAQPRIHIVSSRNIPFLHFSSAIPVASTSHCRLSADTGASPFPTRLLSPGDFCPKSLDILLSRPVL